MIKKNSKQILENNQEPSEMIDNNEVDFDRGELLEEIDVTSFNVIIEESSKNEQ